VREALAPMIGTGDPRFARLAEAQRRAA